MTPRVVAVVPAYEEEDAIGAVVAGIREFDPEIDVVVVDDGSGDRTAELAAAAGATVVRLPFNLGIGAAVQTGFRYALEQDYDVAVRLDGDGQHEPGELPKLLEPLERGEADVVTGSRFREAGSYRPPLGRRLGITWFAKLVSLLSRQRVTDTTSGFQALNRPAIALSGNIRRIDVVDQLVVIECEKAWHVSMPSVSYTHLTLPTICSV